MLMFGISLTVVIVLPSVQHVFSCLLSRGSVFETQSLVPGKLPAWLRLSKSNLSNKVANGIIVNLACHNSMYPFESLAKRLLHQLSAQELVTIEDPCSNSVSAVFVWAG